MKHGFVGLLFAALLALAPWGLAQEQGELVAVSTPGGITFAFFASNIGGEGVVGYLTYIADYDGPLFSSDTQDETTALFTFALETSVRGTFQRGDLVSVIHGPQRFLVYFDDSPDGDFSLPQTFRDGELVAEFENDMVHLAIDRRNGYVDGVSSLRTQVGANGFTVDGIRYAFGRAGDLSRLSVVNVPEPDDPAAVTTAGYHIQMGDQE